MLFPPDEGIIMNKHFVICKIIITRILLPYSDFSVRVILNTVEFAPPNRRITEYSG